MKISDELRIDFAIRKQIKSYMLALLEKRENDKNTYSDTEIERDEYLTCIAKAVTIIISKLKTIDLHKNKSMKFGDFIYKNVHFVVNSVPEHTDLNKLFTTINNSGIQLEQSDILKSLLLKKIKTEKPLYSRIWEACENMNNYFEQNVKKLFPKEFNNGINKYDDLKELPDLNLNEESSKQESNSDAIASYTIANVLKDSVFAGQDEKKLDIEYFIIDKDDENNDAYCRSIITFPQLLLHAYRIFLKNQGKRDFDLPFHSDKLLQIFKSLTMENEDTIKNYFKCLWEVRFVFDKYIIKWRRIEDAKEEELLLTSISSSKNENRISRTNKEPNEISMLQCMLYYTGNYNTQIWLTPYLKHLIDGEEDCLENIDNTLSLSVETDKKTTFAMMDKKFQNDASFNFENYLKEVHGTSFNHYWFYKLEYILWKQLNAKKMEGIDKIKFEKFRITSKNSVEHVFPVNQRYGENIVENNLNSFGNLALLNVSQNSSYSNKSIDEKKIQFYKEGNYNSLKLKDIFDNYRVENWSEEIKKHQESMIEKIKQHYSYV